MKVARPRPFGDGETKGNGIPLGVVVAPANSHDSMLLEATLDEVEKIGLPEEATVHLDKAYDSAKTDRELAKRGLKGDVSRKGKRSPIQEGKRWVVERTNAWASRYRKLSICTERDTKMIEFWLSFVHTFIIVGRLIRQAWTLYRWDSRPSRCP